MPKVDYALMYVTDDSIKDDNSFFHILEASLKGGATIIQLREKTCDTQTFYQRAVRCKEICEKYNTPLLINDRLDIALAIDADGVHIGQTDMPYEVARRLLSNSKIIGLSVSNKEQAEQPNAQAADYIGISPIFSTNTKTTDLAKPLGIAGLKEIRQFYARLVPTSKRKNGSYSGSHQRTTLHYRVDERYAPIRCFSVLYQSRCDVSGGI